MTRNLAALLNDVRDCRTCAEHLPHGPRPVVQVGAGAPIVIIGQAPGRRVHESGTPWADPSGDRLREWLGVDHDTFYDPTKIALIPMGFCFPGTGKSGDLPPRPECAPQWHDQLLAHIAPDALQVIIGMYAQERYIIERGKTLTETVARWKEFLPTQIVMPHPSPRNRRWLSTNPWFEADVIPTLQSLVATRLGPI